MIAYLASWVDTLWRIIRHRGDIPAAIAEIEVELAYWQIIARTVNGL